MIQYSDNRGISSEDAIVISGATSHQEGIEAEYRYLVKNFPGHRVNRQALKNHQGRFYDEMELRLADGTSTKVYFDITQPYGLLMNEFKPR